MAIEEGIKVKFDGDSSGLEAAAKRASTTLGNFKRSTGDATQSLQNLSRVAQDAPYGFMGIANNLNPLIESFQRLKAETGSTKAAFSSLTAGLMGPAGVGLAVGVVSSLLVTFGSKLFESTAATKDQTNALEEFAKVSNDAQESVKALVSQVEHLNRLGKINLGIQFSDSGKAGLEDLMGQSVTNRELVFNLEQNLSKLKANYDNAFSRFQREASPAMQEAFALSSSTGETIRISGTQAEAAMVETLSKLSKTINEKNNEIIGLRNNQTIIYRQIALAQVEIDREYAKKLQENLEKQRKEWENHIRELTKLLDQLAALSSVGMGGRRKHHDTSTQVPGFAEVDSNHGILGNFLAGEREGLNKGLADEGLGILPTKEALDKMVAHQSKAADDAKKVWEDFNKNVSAILSDLRSQLLIGLGEGLGEALAGNGIDSLASSMLGTVGEAISALGKELIIASTAIKAFKDATIAAFKGNPVLGIAVGVGMTAIGSAMKARASKVKTFAQGGIVSTPTLGVFGEYAGAKNNPEVVAPLNKLKSLLGGSMNSDKVLVHEIHGDRLKLILARTDQKQRRSY